MIRLPWHACNSDNRVDSALALVNLKDISMVFSRNHQVICMAVLSRVSLSITACLAHSGLVSFDMANVKVIYSSICNSQYSLNLVEQSIVVANNMNVSKLAEYPWSWQDLCGDKHTR